MGHKTKKSAVSKAQKTSRPVAKQHGPPLERKDATPNSTTSGARVKTTLSWAALKALKSRIRGMLNNVTKSKLDFLHTFLVDFLTIGALVTLTVSIAELMEDGDREVLEERCWMMESDSHLTTETSLIVRDCNGVLILAYFAQSVTGCFHGILVSHDYSA